MIKNKSVILLPIFTIILTASNLLFMYWNEPLQWFVIVMLSSTFIGIILRDIKSEIKLVLLIWILGSSVTIFIMCYPLFIWETNPISINRGIIAITENLIYITFIGIIISLVSSITLTLLLEK